MIKFRITILLSVLLSMIGIKTNAHDIEVANKDGVTIYYNWINDNTELAVSYRGLGSLSYSDEYSGDVDIPESVEYEGNTYSVTSIVDAAFSECSGLTSVIIPNSVISIGNDVFYNCSGLTFVTFGNSVTSIGNGAFSFCSSLTSVIIPNGVTSIGDQTFYGCSGLTTMIIPNSVTSTGVGAFSECSGLTSVSISNSLTSIGPHTFSECSGLTSVTIPNSVTSIGYSAFQNCSGLTSVTIPNSVTSIGVGAFGGCSSLNSIIVESGNQYYDSRDQCNAIINSSTNELIAGCKNTVIPNSVTSIGNSAFSECSGLTSVIIPNSVTTIGDAAFCNCSDLTSVDIPNSVTSIRSLTFSGCSGLTSITIPSSIVSIDWAAFSGCSGLTSITIPNSVTSIADYVFSSCSSLPSVVIPSSVTSIGIEAFSGCIALTSLVVEAGNNTYDSRDNCNAIIETASNSLIVGCKTTVIPNSVAFIGRYAFASCSGLTSVTIPSSVIFIGNYAFLECRGLKNVTSLATTPPQADEQAFDKNDIPLYVPKGSRDAYLATEPWNKFKDIIEIDEEDDVDAIKISDAGQTTWCSAYDLDFTGIEGIKAYTAGGYDRVSGTIWLMRVNQVPANEGILIIGTPGDYKVPHKTTGTYYVNMLKGTLLPITLNETDGEYTNYYLSNGSSGIGFYKVNGSVNLKANRAYLPLLKGTTQAGTRFIGLGFEEDGTTNLTPALSKGEGEGEWYNLQGQRVVKPGKGIYIRNGKMVIVR